MEQEAIVARLVGAFIAAIVTGGFAGYKNRSKIGWGIAGFLFFIIPFIILLFMSKKDDGKDNQINEYVD
jgi:hypothetical protein